MDVESRVALATSEDFTGTVEKVDKGLFTVVFDVGGRGWLRADQLVELTQRWCKDAAICPRPGPCLCLTEQKGSS